MMCAPCAEGPGCPCVKVRIHRKAKLGQVIRGLKEILEHVK